MTLPEGWWICNVDGCLVSPYDRRCPMCEWRLLGPRESRELALLLPDGVLVRDSGWRCVADVMAGFIGFGLKRAIGVIVDAETLVQVYPPPQLIDGAGTRTD